ncbi:hypothetical protein GCM10027051_32530 [Niabella terrae]
MVSPLEQSILYIEKPGGQIHCDTKTQYGIYHNRHYRHTYSQNIKAEYPDKPDDDDPLDKIDRRNFIAQLHNKIEKSIPTDYFCKHQKQ